MEKAPLADDRISREQSVNGDIERNRIMRAVITATLIGLAACNSANAATGPAKGSLVIVGGAMRDPAILMRFIELAGGVDSPIVVVPTALSFEIPETRLKQFAKPFFDVGCTDVTVVHTGDPKVADTDAFIAPIKRARGVWFGGGRQWRLVDAYAGTKAESAFHAVLDRGGVIGGSSAGATIQGDFLVRGAPQGNTIMMSPGHEAGFGYLKGAAIDQHVIARSRQKDLIPVIEAHPELLGLGIDENTALVVRGNTATVIGQSSVLVYTFDKLHDGDAAQWVELKPGDTLDLANRASVHTP